MAAANKFHRTMLRCFSRAVTCSAATARPGGRIYRFPMDCFCTCKRTVTALWLYHRRAVAATQPRQLLVIALVQCGRGTVLAGVVPIPCILSCLGHPENRAMITELQLRASGLWRPQPLIQIRAAAMRAPKNRTTSTEKGKKNPLQTHHTWYVTGV